MDDLDIDALIAKGRRKEREEPQQEQPAQQPPQQQQHWREGPPWGRDVNAAVALLAIRSAELPQHVALSVTPVTRLVGYEVRLQRMDAAMPASVLAIPVVPDQMEGPPADGIKNMIEEEAQQGRSSVVQMGDGRIYR